MSTTGARTKNGGISLTIADTGEMGATTQEGRNSLVNTY